MLTASLLMSHVTSNFCWRLKICSEKLKENKVELANSKMLYKSVELDLSASFHPIDIF